MLNRWRTAVFALAVVACTVVPAQAQVSVVTVRSIDDLFADLRYVLTLAGQEGRAREVENLIGSVTAGKRFEGIDTRKPIGLYLNEVKETTTPPIVVFIPITKEDEFTDLVKRLGGDVQKAEKGIHPVDTPLGQTVYLRFANKHAYVALESDKLEGDLPDPAKFVPAANQKNLIAASTRLDMIPAEQKKEILEKLDEQLAEQKEKKESESDQEYQFRMAATKAAREIIGLVIEDGEQSYFSFNIDREGGNLSLAAGVTGKRGTKLAERIKELGPAGNTAPVHIEVSVGKLAMLFLPEKGEKAEQVRKLLSGEDKGKDKVRITLAGGDTLVLKLDVNSQVIRLIAALAPQDGDD